MNRWIRILYFLTICLTGFSCEEGKDPAPQLVDLEEGKMVFIGHEGNFKWGNAGLGVLNLGKNQVDMQYYKTTNKEDLGDVFQSATFWNGQWWLVVNNSGKIEVTDPGMKKRRTVSGFTSPRYLTPVSTEKAYVSDLYAKGLWVIFKNQAVASSKIDMPGWTEEMLMLDGKVYVVCRTNAKLIRIDPQNDQVLDSVLLPGNASSIAKAGNGRIWVGFDAGKNSAFPGIGLWNPSSGQMEKTWFSSATGQIPDRFHSSSSGDSLFFICGVPCMLQTTDSRFLPFPVGAGNWYGLGYDAKRKQIYASDVKDYLQSSRIVQMDLSGNILKEWKGGVISSQFYFW